MEMAFLHTVSFFFCWWWLYHLSDSMNINICRDCCPVLECPDTEGSGFFCILTCFKCTCPRSAPLPTGAVLEWVPSICDGQSRGEMLGWLHSHREKVLKENNLKNLKSHRHNSYQILKPIRILTLILVWPECKKKPNNFLLLNIFYQKKSVTSTNNGSFLKLTHIFLP